MKTYSKRLNDVCIRQLENSLGNIRLSLIPVTLATFSHSVREYSEYGCSNPIFISVLHSLLSIVSQSIRVILREVKSAIRMLTLFEDTYLQERQLVEATSQDNRWEFDRKILFGDIHYMKKILTDIFDMAKVKILVTSFISVFDRLRIIGPSNFFI